MIWVIQREPFLIKSELNLIFTSCSNNFHMNVRIIFNFHQTKILLFWKINFYQLFIIQRHFRSCRFNEYIYDRSKNISRDDLSCHITTPHIKLICEFTRREMYLSFNDLMWIINHSIHLKTIGQANGMPSRWNTVKSVYLVKGPQARFVHQLSVALAHNDERTFVFHKSCIAFNLLSISI